MKPRFAMYWAAGCGGCDIAVLNVNELLLEVGEAFDVVFWPAAMDAKYADVEAMPDRSIDLTLFTGGIRNEENREIAELLRARSKTLVAFGSCACEGCIPGLANLSTVDELLAASFGADRADTADASGPVLRWASPEGPVLRLPGLLPLVRTLDQTVPVDYYLPGCPPESARIAEVLRAVLAAISGGPALPPPGSILGAGTSTVCEQCARTRNEKRIARFARIQELERIDPAMCLLEQGLPCNGPATRDGCGALCPAAGVPCIGCYGPTEGVLDGGARLLSAFASVADATEPEDIERILDGIPDPIGQAYRCSLPASLLRGSRKAVAAAVVAEAAPEAQATVPAEERDLVGSAT
jgi:F420-non-reducing hydrogenase small subunit